VKGALFMLTRFLDYEVGGDDGCFFGVIMQYNRNNMQKLITFAAVLQKS
jgi:hypothetical protein